MSLLSKIIQRVKNLIDKAKEKLPLHKNNAAYDMANESDVEEGTTGNPITDLYNKALTHPATTLGLLAAALGVAAAVAYVVAEQRAQKGIAREMERKSVRLRKRMRVWTKVDALPRVKNYRRKYRRIKRW